MAEKATNGEKTLRIIFSGISTLYPGPPMNGEKSPDKAFVLMAANPKKENGKRTKQEQQADTSKLVIPEHAAFVMVDRAALENPPKPDDGSGKSDSGDCIYYIQDARVKIAAPESQQPLSYYMDLERPLADRPGSFDVAPAGDIRWLADLRDLLPEPVPIKETADPNERFLGDEVAAVVDLDCGELRANFPCDTVAAKTFKAPDSDVVVSGFKRALATEFTLDIHYPKETKTVTLSFEALRQRTPVTGPKGDELVLKWPEGHRMLEVRMGNDTKEEVRRLNTPGRCDPRRQDGPVLKPQDPEFDLHYNVLAIPKGGERPLPQNDPRQCSADGCKPATTDGGGTP